VAVDHAEYGGCNYDADKAGDGVVACEVEHAGISRQD
jgi:hypothetical protein